MISNLNLNQLIIRTTILEFNNLNHDKKNVILTKIVETEIRYK